MYKECCVCHKELAPDKLVFGICLECLEKKRMAIVTREKAVKIINNHFEQKVKFGG